MGLAKRLKTAVRGSIFLAGSAEGGRCAERMANESGRQTEGAQAAEGPQKTDILRKERGFYLLTGWKKYAIL